MKKMLLCFITVLLLTMGSVFAAPLSSYIIVKPDCITVDLAATQYTAHNSNAHWSSGKPTSASATNPIYYYDNQILAVIGMENTKDKNLPVTISLELVSQEWSYVLDDRYKRPFGVDLFARGSATLGSGGGDIEGYSLHFGSQNNQSDGNDTIVLPVSVVQNYDVVWWDICLVMDPPVDTDSNTATDASGNTYDLTPTDTLYTAILQVTISCGDVEDVYNLYLQGRYKSAATSSSSTQLMLSVQKLSTANTIDITDLFTARGSQNVAQYGFTSTEKPTSDTSGTVSMFLSSSSNGLASTSEFVLRRVLSNGTVSNRETEFNSIPFRATLTSTKGSKAGDDVTRSVTYDGTDYFGNPSTPANYMVVKAEAYKNHMNNTYVLWADAGTISVSFPDTRAVTQGTMSPREEIDVNVLVSGQYTGNIYFHIVTDGL